MIKVNRVPTGNLGQTAAPAEIYCTKDGWVLCQVTGHPLFIRWARLMGEEDRWLSDPRFADDIKRGDADRHAKLLIHLGVEGTLLDAFNNQLQVRVIILKLSEVDLVVPETT